MLPPAEAEKLIREHLAPFPPEDCPLANAQGRILRADIRAHRDLPPFDRVTMDGYALRAASLAAGVRRFRVESVQAAGQPAGQLSPAPEACIEIATGAVLPAGADTIVPYEETTRESDAYYVTLSGEAPRPGNAVHPCGSDCRAGETLVRAGTRLSAREIAVAAACGGATLSVSRRPRIAVVATGDELVEVGALVAPHQVRRSNDLALGVGLAVGGFPGAACFHWRDDPAVIAGGLARALSDFDVLLLTGGVSKGKFDHLPGELERQGVKKIFHGVAQRPGKPMWFGVGPGGTLVFALPGNPVSAYTCLHRYVLPALDRASGAVPTVPRAVALEASVIFKPKLAYFLPVKLTSGAGAELLATPAPVNTSGDFAGLVGTDGFIELAAERNEFPTGTLVPFWAWM